MATKKAAKSKASAVHSRPDTVAGSGPPRNLLVAIDLVRAKLRDYPELNRLVSGQETSDRQLALHSLHVVEDFNTTPPLISPSTLEGFPSMSLLVDGIIVQVLQSVGLLQLRNHMQYSDGQGVQVSTSDKGPQLLSYANMFMQSYEAKKARLKVAMNLQGALNGSGLASEYSVVNGWFEDIT